MKKNLVFSIFFFLFLKLVLVSNCLAISSDLLPFPPVESKPIPGSFIVEFAYEPASFGDLKSIERLTTDGKFYRITTPTTSSRETVFQELRKTLPVKRVGQNYTIPLLAYWPNDPYFRKTPQDDPLNHYQWNLARINAPQAWEITRGKESVKVAIIDSGLAFEDYQDPVTGKTYKKAPELEGVKILPGLRYMDTVCGIQCQFGGCCSLYPIIEDSHPVDEVGHGTHVTMTIVQAMNNNKHATGIAPQVSLIPISPAIKHNPEALSVSAILKALDFAKEQKVDVINMSFGTHELWRDKETYQIFENKIKELYDAGIILVAAAGNSGDWVGWPAAFPQTIAVGASRWDNDRTLYSSYKKSGYSLILQGVTLLAPGGEIYRGGQNLEDLNKDNLADGIVQQTIKDGNPTQFTEITDYCLNATHEDLMKDFLKNGNFRCGIFCGTSMASPHVTAIVALMKSVNPTLSPKQAKEILKEIANKNIPNYSQEKCGAGLVDAYAAVLEAQRLAPCPLKALGNLDCDPQGIIGNLDLEILLSFWGQSGDADLNQDGKINEADLSLLLANWNSSSASSILPFHSSPHEPSKSILKRVLSLVLWS